MSCSEASCRACRDAPGAASLKDERLFILYVRSYIIKHCVGGSHSARIVWCGRRKVLAVRGCNWLMSGPHSQAGFWLHHFSKHVPDSTLRLHNPAIAHRSTQPSYARCMPQRKSVIPLQILLSRMHIDKTALVEPPFVPLCLTSTLPFHVR